MTRQFLVTAALDFGTTFCGYAFTFQNNAEKIIVNKNWGESFGFQLAKTPSSILTNKDGEFVAMGNEAELKYLDPESEGEFHLFRHFKMILHKSKNVSKVSEVEALDGTKRPALDIFSQAINYLSTHLMEAVNKASDVEISSDQVYWIVTVPAIWSEQSKQFMREAAKKGGCLIENTNNVMLCLEPEAASLCCRRPEVAGFSLADGKDLEPGTKYIILDCGGGTVDTIAHEVLPMGKVKESLQASGGPWGAMYVDKEFQKLFGEIFGVEFVKEFVENEPLAWLKLLSAFEMAKRVFKPQASKSIIIDLSWSFYEFFQKKHNGSNLQHFIKSKNAGVKLSNGSLILSKEVAQKLFAPVVDCIVEHTEHLLNKEELKGCKYIFMVGGFSECAVLQHAIRTRFDADGIQVLIPSDAQLAVLKGAVLCGHHQSEITSRIARRTYGIGLTVPFNPSIHREDFCVTSDDGKKGCRNVFVPMIQKGDAIESGHTVTRQDIPRSRDTTSSVTKIYAIDAIAKSPVQYVKGDPDVECIGKVTSYFKPCNDRKENEMKKVFTFGDTELRVCVVHLASGKEFESRLDLPDN